jgi:hypothetical protein
MPRNRRRHRYRILAQLIYNAVGPSDQQADRAVRLNARR